MSTSTTALKVFWAFNRAASGKPNDWHYKPAIAAALRVVAKELSYGHGSGEPILDEHDLLSIADELEAE